MKKLIYFLVVNCQYVFLTMFGALCVIAVVNFVYNPYFSQNKRLKKFTKCIASCNCSVAMRVKLLPKEYQRQWRAYVNSGAKNPSTVFEFVQKHSFFKFLPWHVLLLVVSLAYTVMGIALQDGFIVITQMAFLLASILAWLLNMLIQELNLHYARKRFGKTIHQLNVAVQLTKPQTNTDNCVQQLEVLQQDLPINTIDKAVCVLKQKGIDEPRTVEEQRRLNVALNSLVQAYGNKKHI